MISLCKNIFKAIIGLSLAFHLTGCSLSSPVREEAPSKVSLTPISAFKSEWEISDLKYIDVLGQVLAVADDGGIFLDIKSGKPAAQISAGDKIDKVALDSSGRLIMLSSRDRVRIIDVTNKNILWEKMDDRNSGDQVSAFAPDGQSLYAFSKIWTLKNPQPIKDVYYPAAPMSSEISRDNRFLLNTGLYGAIDLADMKTGKYLHEWDTDNFIAGGIFSLDSKSAYIVNGAKGIITFSRKTNRIAVYDLTTYERKEQLTHDGNITTLVTSPTTGDIFTGTDTGEIYQWSANTFENTARWKGNGRVQASTTDESGRVWFGYDNGELKLYDPKQKALSTVTKLQASITKIAVSKNSDVLTVVEASGQKREVLIFQVMGLQ